MPQPSLPRRRPRVAVAALAVAAGLLAQAVGPAAPAAAAPPPTYVAPVDAPVHDPFRAPEGPYGPGNRGIEYDTPAGTVVRAPADGQVTFAGWVGGARHVTVLHPDGVRTTASYLDEVAVVVGQDVRQGDVLGTTVGRLHFGARRGDAYFDPATLFEGPVRVRLVPFDEPPGGGPAGERSAITQLLALGRGVLGAASAGVDAARAVGGWAGSRAVDTASIAWHYLPYLSPHLRVALLVRLGFDVATTAWAMSHRPCTPDGTPVPPPAERRIGLLVAGLGSSSGPTSIDDLDVDALGYDVGDVLRFSYAGGRIPGGQVVLPGLAVRPYDASHSHQDLRVSGARLADLVEVVAAAAPGVPIDLLAHSQGGVVARLALLELEDRHGAAWLERVGLLATVATPHGGTGAATMAAALETTAIGPLVLDQLDEIPGLDPDAPSVAQLAETSDVVAQLGREGLPPGVDAVSIAARGDLVVPGPRTDLAGARDAVVPLSGLTAHADLPGDPRTTREVALALTGAPPRCVGFGTALADQLVGEAIGWAEDRAGASLWLRTLPGGGLPVP